MSFLIKNLQIPGQMILAPMDGYTSQPFRLLSRRLGSSASYSEFIGALEIVNKHPFMTEKLSYSNEERPFAFQVFDNDTNRILKAAIDLRQRNPDFLDVNLGCSSRHVSSRGAGAGLLKTPNKITEILELLVKNLDIPITAKIRLGWDENSKNFLDVSKRIEQAGCSAIAIHARTRQQGYGGNADWLAIQAVKNSVKIPVIGNGDIKSFKDVGRMMGETGCDAVMIGRAALANPWIFSSLERENVPKDLVYQTVKELLKLMQSFYGENRGVIYSRKFLARFIAPFNVDVEVRQNLLTASTAERVKKIMARILQIE